MITAALRKKRRCLRCSSLFSSGGPQNRICKECRTKEELLWNPPPERHHVVGLRLGGYDYEATLPGPMFVASQLSYESTFYLRR